MRDSRWSDAVGDADDVERRGDRPSPQDEPLKGADGFHPFIVLRLSPRSIERGIGEPRVGLVDPLVASMWPRSIERAIERISRDTIAQLRASMWPRSIERGISGSGSG
ncbi:MAG: hypothetical protein DMF86_21740 [Acidobacteria bacterium]|nr:MAG: hypothetical protein DMF86_21740 [Acidobacteriota bacterium]